MKKAAQKWGQQYLVFQREIKERSERQGLSIED
jgi:hypothetical protein